MAKKINETQIPNKSSARVKTSKANDNIDQKQLLATLRESEKRYRSFIENFQGIAYEADAEIWTPIFFHGAVEEITGYTEEDFTAGNPRWDEIIHPDDFPNLPGKDEASRVPDYSIEREYRIIRKDGKTRWVREFLHNVSDESGKISQIQGTLYNVTERKQIEKALRKSERKYRDLVESALVGVATTTLEGDVLYANDTFLNKLEYETLEEFAKGGAVAKYKYPENRKELLRKIKESGRIENYEVELVTKCGETIFFLESCTLDGHVMHCTLVDITERKQTEDQLRAEKEFTDTALNAQLDTFFLFEPATGKALRWNRAFRDISGYTDEEIARMPAPDSYYSPADLESATAFIQNVLVEETGTIELALICKDGSRIPTEYRVAVIKNEKGEPKYIISIGRDITDRKLAEEEIHKLNEELEQRVVKRTAELEATNKELEAFAYSISHDLRAPLRAINSFSRVLQEKYSNILDEEGSGYLDKVMTSTLKMDELINDLLALSRLGRQEFMRTTTNLTHIANRIFRDMVTKEPAREIKFVVSDLPLVEVDVKLMEVMLNNLLSNAIKFTRGKAPAVIEFGNLPESEAPTFYMRDNGVGFDMKYAHKLFSPFQRLHTQREFEGTGIGLAIVQRIVRRHGGEVWVEAEPDKGATFFFTIE
ncbi:MAG: PAS domain-containing sensor histidine kinase [Candidatus Hermodarchaeia archaeon]|jgi:PAS domain S-box-containing protein